MKSPHFSNLEPSKQNSVPEPQPKLSGESMIKQALKEHVNEMMSKSKEAIIKSSIKSGSSSGPQEGSVKGGGMARKG